MSGILQAFYKKHYLMRQESNNQWVRLQDYSKTETAYLCMLISVVSGNNKNDYICYETFIL